MSMACWHVKKLQIRRTVHQQGVTWDAGRLGGKCRAGSAGARGDLSGAIGSWGLGGSHLVLCAPVC